MKKPKKFLVIAAITLSLVGAGTGAYISYSKAEGVKQQVEVSNNVIKVEKGDIKTIVEAGGKVSLSDENKSNPNAITITLSTNQYDVSKLQVNQAVEIKSKAFPEEVIEGTITEVSNKANEGDSPAYNVTVEVAKPVLEIGECTYSEVDVRKGPSKEYGKQTKIEKGKEFQILEKKNNWVKIRLEDKTEGWVPKDSVKSKGIGNNNIESKIAGKEATLRNSNSSNSKSLGKLMQGEKVKIIDKKDDWYKVEVNQETTGWLHESDLSLQKLIDGMSVTGIIVVSESKDVIKVPVSAVNKDEKGYYVNIANTNEKRYIEVGDSDSEYIEVTKGLSENESISVPSFVAPTENSGSSSNTDEMTIG